MSVAWSVSIRSQKARESCFRTVRDWNCGIRDWTKLSGTLDIDVTLGSDGGGSAQPVDSDVSERPSLDPEDW